MIVFRTPSLPDAEGRPELHDISVEYQRGRNLSGYLRKIGLEQQHVSHVIYRGVVIRPSDTVTVMLPERPVAKFWRELRRKPAPVDVVPAFDAFMPPDGAELILIPTIDGKHSSIILGIVGAVVGAAIAIATGGAGAALAWSIVQSGLSGFAIGSTIGSLIAPHPREVKDKDGPSSYIWGGMTNDFRAGVPKPVMLGERLVGGVVVSAFRRRPNVVPPRTGPGVYDDTAPQNGSEKLFMLVLVAGHETEGPVGKTNPNLAANTTTNKPDIRLNGQHYSDFTGVEAEWRTGAAGQTVIPGFDVAAATYDFNIDLYAAGSFTYVTASDTVDAFEVLLSLPALVHSDGNKLLPNTAYYTLQYRKQGDIPWIDFDYDNPRQLKGMFQSPGFETRRIENLAPARYEIRISGIGAAFVDPTKDAWRFFLNGITEESQSSNPHPGDSLVAIKGLATEQLSGNIVVSSVWRGYKPQTWEPILGFQTVPWGVGDAAPVGRNRGWLTLALMRDKEIGAGNEIADEDIDLASAKAFADYCAEAVDVTPTVGDPYTEPRSQLDCYIDQQQDTIPLLQEFILPPANSTLIFSGTKWRIGVDKPGTAVQLFSMGNIKRTDGVSNFQHQYKSERAELNCYDVTFDDEKADWQSEPVTVCIDNRDLTAGGGVFRTEEEMVSLSLPVLRQSLQLFGVSRRSEAVRSGRFRLRQVYALRELGGFGASTDALFAECYDIVNLSHDLPQWGYSGRCMPNDLASASLVMFDRTIPFDPLQPSQIMVRFNAGSDTGDELIEIRDVADASDPDSGDYFGLFVTTPFSKIPTEGDLWVWGPVGTLVKPVRIIEIDRDENLQRVVSWAEYNESIYDLDGPIIFPDYSLLPNFGAAPGPIPEVHAAIEIIDQKDGSKITSVLIQWTKPKPDQKYGFYKGARVEYSIDAGASWNVIQSVDGTEFRWLNPPHDETVLFRVTPYSTSGRYNFAGAATSDPLHIRWWNEPAPDLTGFAASYAGDAAVWKWIDPGREFQIELRDSDANWGVQDAHLIYRGRATEFKITGPTFRNKTLYARAFDAFLNYSTNTVFAAFAKTAPVAPFVNTGNIVRTDEGIKIPVGTTTDPEVRGIYLWASQSVGFTPNDATRVGQIVSPGGGEFVFKTITPGTYYFRVAAADPISDRLKDFVYSSEFPSSIFVIQPQTPTAVAFGETPNISGRRRAVLPGGAQVTQQKIFALFVNWTFTDAVNPLAVLIGFQVIVYEQSAGSPNNPWWDSGIMANTSQRACGIPDLTIDAAANYVAAVRAVYIDGYSSPLATSTGLLLDPSTGQPLQTADDRNVAVYAETFDSAVVPTGFTKSPSDSLFASNSALIVDAGNPANTWIEWDLRSWALAYLDYFGSLPFGSDFSVQVAINVQHSTLASSTAKGTFTPDIGGIPVQRTVTLTADLQQHIYRFDFQGQFLTGGSTAQPKFRLDLSGVFTGVTQWSVLGIAVVFDDVDWRVDGFLDRAINARDQFDRDPSFGGFFLESPIRQPGDKDGNIVVIDNGGVFVVRSNGTDTAYKRGRRGRLTGIFNNAFIPWDSSAGSVVDPVIPRPDAMNKARILVEGEGGSDIQVGSFSGSGQTVFRYTEATEFLAGGFRFHDIYIVNGSKGKFSRTGVGQTAQFGRPILKDASRGNWGWAELTSLFSAPSTVWNCYRMVIWLKIAMPLIKKPTGGYYTSDLTFDFRRGRTTGGTPMPIDGANFTNHFSSTARFVTDGQIQYHAFVLGNTSLGNNVGSFSDTDKTVQNIQAFWSAQTDEAGAGVVAPIVELDKVDVSFISSASSLSSVAATGGNNFTFLYAEEF
jgi:hypothetical protein